MAEQIIKNNIAEISGKVVSEFTYSHEVYGEGFYSFNVEVPRLSDSFDIIPVMVSERLLDVTTSYVGQYVIAQGQFRSYNKHEEGKSRLLLSVFVREIHIVSEPTTGNPNSIFLDGFICKKPIYRKTPLGREITDLLLAVNRPYNKSDYIPAIAWGRNARFAQNLGVGTNLCIWGRIQSRTYQKKDGDGAQVSTRIAYEVSISKMEISKKEEEKQGE